MRFARHENWIAVSLCVSALLIGSMVLSGCSEPTPKKPAGAAKPAEAGKPAEAAKPAEEPKPAEAAKPAEEPKPAEAAKPAEEPKPAEAAKPAGAAKPAEEPKPAEAAKPAEGAAPTAAGSPEDKVSTYAPAEDLLGQVDFYVKRLEGYVASEDDYKANRPAPNTPPADAVDKIAQDANTLVVVALGLGMHDTDNKVKGSAGALLKAAQNLATAPDFAATKAAVEAVKAATASQGSSSPVPLKWEKVAVLRHLMLQVSPVNTKMKTCIRRLDRRGKEAQGHSAVLAVIAQGSLPNVAETEKPTEAEAWLKHCLQMRSAAFAVNTAIRANDKAAIEAAMVNLQKSCDDCHTIFSKKALEKKDLPVEE